MSSFSTALLGMQGVLALAMVGAGGAKIAGIESQIEEFQRYGYPQWFRLATGGIELLAGVVLVAGLFVTPVLALGGSLLVATMVGAVVTHVRMGDPATDIAPSAILLMLALGVSWYHVGTL